jgi:hypothetical protein
MIVPQRLQWLEDTCPKVRDLRDNVKLYHEFKVWHESCRDFNQRLKHGEPAALKLGWQRYYYNGTAPHAKCAPIAEAGAHRTLLNLRAFEEQIDDTH